MDVIVACILFNIAFLFVILFWFYGHSRSRCDGFSLTKQLQTFYSHCIPNVFRRAAADVYLYLFHSRGSFFQILYLFLVVTIHVSIINDGLAVLRHVDPETSHLFLPLLILGINFSLFILCCYSNPGVITKDNVDSYVAAYPYDDQMYTSGTHCDTCHLVKPARSKHCSVYNRCVFKFDHYCIWVRNCIGGLNHRYFLLLLSSLTIMCVHGSYATFKVLRAITQVSKFMNTSYISTDGQKQPMTFYVLVKILCTRYPRLVLCECSLVVLSIVVGCFTLYHLRFAIHNETTNERYKRHAILKSGKAVKKNVYDKGILENLKEEVIPFDERMFHKSN